MGSELAAALGANKLSAAIKLLDPAVAAPSREPSFMLTLYDRAICNEQLGLGRKALKVFQSFQDYLLSSIPRTVVVAAILQNLATSLRGCPSTLICLPPRYGRPANESVKSSDLRRISCI